MTASVDAITHVGPGLPVLLAWVDHDFFFPDSGETDYWKAHCACDVESWTQPDAGHASSPTGRCRPSRTRS